MTEHHVAGLDSPPEHRLERLIFFSDAVFAIAITLLVIEIHPPHLHAGAPVGEWLQALATLSPALTGFVVSFFVIGAFWTGHHRAFALARHWDERVVGRNLLVLFTIAAMPFFTALSSSNPTARLPVMLYCSWLLFAGFANVRLQRLVTTPPVADPETAAAGTALRRRGFAVVAGAATALLLCAILPYPSLGLLGLATIGLWRRLFVRQQLA